MKCPKCNSEKATKNGRRGKQYYQCLDCGRLAIAKLAEGIAIVQVTKLFGQLLDIGKASDM